MSVPLHTILNDQDVSPKSSRTKRPASATTSSIPTGFTINRATAHEIPPPFRPRDLAANAPHKRPRASSSELGTHSNRPTPSSPYKGLRLGRSPTSQPTTPAKPPKPTNPFNLFSSLLKHPELTLEFTKHLPLDTLISLYAISQPFHALVNTRFTTLITTQANLHAPESASVFIFRCYASLCQRDPVARPNETKVPARQGTVRWVPSFRWLKMIIFREMVVDEILSLLAAEGHLLPAGSSLAVKKIWFTMDISDNFRRVGLMHNRAFWKDEDLYLATEFVIKLDMRLTHPVTGTGDTGMRKMLLGQRSLSTLWRVLKREEMQTQLDVLRMIVRWNYEPQRLWNVPIMGVPPEEVGALQWEGWGARGRHQLMMQVDQLVMREGIKRRLKLQECYLDMLLDGFVDKERWRDFRRDKDVEIVVERQGEGDEGEWETESEGEGEEAEEELAPEDEEHFGALGLPQWIMSPRPQAMEDGDDTEEDSGPGTYPYKSSGEEGSDREGDWNPNSGDTMDETAG